MAWTEEWNEDSRIQAFDFVGNRAGPKIQLHPQNGANQNSPAVAWFKGWYVWAYNDYNYRHVFGANSKSGTPLRFTPANGPANELRVSASTVAWASVWASASGCDCITHRSMSGVETVLGLGNDCEIDMQPWGGVVVWSWDGTVKARELGPTGEIVGDEWVVWSGAKAEELLWAEGRKVEGEKRQTIQEIIANMK